MSCSCSFDCPFQVSATHSEPFVAPPLTSASLFPVRASFSNAFYLYLRAALLSALNYVPPSLNNLHSARVRFAFSLPELAVDFPSPSFPIWTSNAVCLPVARSQLPLTFQTSNDFFGLQCSLSLALFVCQYLTSRIAWCVWVRIFGPQDLAFV